MASFLKNVTQKVGEAAQAAAKKSGEMVEIVKLKRDIGGEEDKIQNMFREIGKKVYDNFCANQEAGPEFQEICLNIRTCEENISELKEKINEIGEQKSAPAEGPASKFCSSCGSTLEAEAKFCPKCGNKL